MSFKDLTILHQAQRMQTQSQEPVTFYDILMLLRELGDPGEASPQLLDTFALLTTHAHLTDGARQVLRSFLRGRATLYAQERARAQRGVTVHDHQKRVRLIVDTWCFLYLPQQRGTQTKWEIARCDDGVQVASPAEAGLTGREATRISFAVKAIHPGNFALTLRSKANSEAARQMPVGKRVRSFSVARSDFTLFLTAEPS